MWSNDTFLYKKGYLRCIADSYNTLHEDGLSFREGSLITKYDLIGEYVADFENALSNLGREFKGIKDVKFKDFKDWNVYQRIIIASLMNISDKELEGLMFYDINRLRSIAFSRMTHFLNKVD